MASDKVRFQIPVSQEFADYVTELGMCLKWSQGATAAALLEEGLQSREKIEQWFAERVSAAVVNMARGKARVKSDGMGVVYMQTFVSRKAIDAIEQLAIKLKNTPARTATMVLESAAYDNGWIIEALGSGPSQALVKFVAAMTGKHRGKQRVATV
jgi:hypothetical protein